MTAPELDPDTIDALTAQLGAAHRALVLAGDDCDDPVFRQLRPHRDRLRGLAGIAGLVTRQLGG
jgi:hypothetical protein